MLGNAVVDVFTVVEVSVQRGVFLEVMLARHCRCCHCVKWEKSVFKMPSNPFLTLDLYLCDSNIQHLLPRSVFGHATVPLAPMLSLVFPVCYLEIAYLATASPHLCIHHKGSLPTSAAFISSLQATNMHINSFTKVSHEYPYMLQLYIITKPSLHISSFTKVSQ
ncbi:hypothetical protein L7F22_063016 [Adiantum nelumboides]|nr:hypothetical protein [Adiantum nelumboides]